METYQIEATVFGPACEGSHILRIGYDIEIGGFGLWLTAHGYPNKSQGSVQLQQLLAFIPDRLATAADFMERFEKLGKRGIVFTSKRVSDNIEFPIGDRYFELPYAQWVIDRFLDLAPCIRAPEPDEWIKYTPPEYDPRMYYPAITLVSMQPLFPMPSEDHAA